MARTAGLHLRLIRTKADAANDADPSVTPPAAADVFEPSPFANSNKSGRTRGFRVKVEFAAGNTADLTPWYRNDDADDTEEWSAGTTISIVPNRIYIEEDSGDCAVYFRLTNISDGEPLTIWAEELS